MEFDTIIDYSATFREIQEENHVSFSIASLLSYTWELPGYKISSAIQLNRGVQSSRVALFSSVHSTESLSDGAS